MNARFGQAFSCPSCGERLRIPDFYTKRIGIVSFVVSFVVLFLYGLRWFVLLAVAASIFLPVSFVVGTVMRHVSPPVLQLDEPNDAQSSMGP
jgi:hypothetical protein